VVILPGCGADEAAAIAERLRELVVGSETTVPVTVSAGVATFPANAVDDGALVDAADEVLYESKRLGRNRVSTSRRRTGPIPVSVRRAAS
jgi:diguanylate cyclase